MHERIIISPAGVFTAFLICITAAACFPAQSANLSASNLAEQKNALLAADQVGCIDPDLNKIAKGTKLMLCDGSLAEGALELPVDCSVDGQENCVNNGKFKSVRISTLDSTDILYGKNVAGVVGTRRAIKKCLNTVDLSKVDATYPPANVMARVVSPAIMNAGTTDIIELGVVHELAANAPVHFRTTGSLPAEITAGETYYAIIASPTTIQLAAVPGGPPIDFSSNGTGSHTILELGDGHAAYYDTTEDRPGNRVGPWGGDYVCDSRNITDVSLEIKPSGAIPLHGNLAFTNVWRDELSGILFTNRLYDGSGSSTWWHAVHLCESLNTPGTALGWRLPTQKELMQLYIDGIFTLNIFPAWPPHQYWSSTAVSINPGLAWASHLYQMRYYNGLRTSTVINVICIR